MNEIAWDKLNSLHAETVSTLMFLALNGSPLEDFDPLPHMHSWLTGELSDMVPVSYESACCVMHIYRRRLQLTKQLGKTTAFV